MGSHTAWCAEQGAAGRENFGTGRLTAQALSTEDLSLGDFLLFHAREDNEGFGGEVAQNGGAINALIAEFKQRMQGSIHTAHRAPIHVDAMS